MKSFSKIFSFFLSGLIAASSITNSYAITIKIPLIDLSVKSTKNYNFFSYLMEDNLKEIYGVFKDSFISIPSWTLDFAIMEENLRYYESFQKRLKMGIDDLKFKRGYSIFKVNLKELFKILTKIIILHESIYDQIIKYKTDGESVISSIFFVGDEPEKINKEIQIHTHCLHDLAIILDYVTSNEKDLEKFM